MTANLLKVATVASALATPLAAQSFNLSDLGINLPQQGAQMMCDKAPSHDYFKSFHCPLMAEAMYFGDPSILAGTTRGEQFAYITAWVTAVHDPTIVYKIDPSVYTTLDPRLPMHVRYLMATNPDVLGDIAGESINIWKNVAEDFLGARRNAVDSNTLDPMGELAAILGGIARAPKPITLTTEIAQHDVMAWIGLALSDPDAAVQLYQGMRTIAVNF